MFSQSLYYCTHLLWSESECMVLILSKMFDVKFVSGNKKYYTLFTNHRQVMKMTITMQEYWSADHQLRYTPTNLVNVEMREISFISENSSLTHTKKYLSRLTVTVSSQLFAFVCQQDMSMFLSFSKTN